MARRRKTTRIIASARPDISVTEKQSALGQVKELWEVAESARLSAANLQRVHDMEDLREDELPVLPDKAPEDIRQISDSMLTPNAKAIVDQFSQQLRVEGIRLEDSEKNAPAWQLFQRNRMGSKQVSLYKSMLTQGLAYASALPAVGRLDGKPTAAFDLRSAKRATAFYRDSFDEWPELYLDVDRIQNSDGTVENVIVLMDEGRVHRMSCPEGEPDKLAYIDNFRHGMDICPVQKFGYMDLDGNARGEVEPYLPLLRRIDQDTSDRLVLQRFASWLVRWATGVKQPTNEEQQRVVEAWLAIGDMLINDSPDAKFGTLAASPMDGHIRAREADIRDLAATSQVPSYRMLGLADNIGSEAIAAADASLKRKMDEYKAILGEQMESLLRIGGYAMGDETIASDFTSRVVWAKTDAVDIQSMAQAITTLWADGEGLPMELMWERLDGWTQQDTIEAKRIRDLYLETKRSQELLMNAMGGIGGNDTGNAARPSASAGASESR